MRERLFAALRARIGRSRQIAVEKIAATDALARQLLHDYEQSGRLDLLNAAIELFREVVSGTPADHPDRPGHLSNLGTTLHARFERSGQLADLDEAMAASRDAVATAPPGHHNREVCLYALGGMLRSRFERSGQLADLDEALSAGRKAVAATHPVTASGPDICPASA